MKGPRGYQGPVIGHVAPPRVSDPRGQTRWHDYHDVAVDVHERVDDDGSPMLLFRSIRRADDLLTVRLHAGHLEWSYEPHPADRGDR